MDVRAPDLHELARDRLGWVTPGIGPGGSQTRAVDAVMAPLLARLGVTRLARASELLAFGEALRGDPRLEVIGSILVLHARGILVADRRGARERERDDRRDDRRDNRRDAALPPVSLG